MRKKGGFRLDVLADSETMHTMTSCLQKSCATTSEPIRTRDELNADPDEERCPVAEPASIADAFHGQLMNVFHVLLECGRRNHMFAVTLKTRDNDHDYMLIDTNSSFEDSSGQKVTPGVRGVKVQVQNVRYLAFPESVGNNHFARLYVWNPQGQWRPLMNTGPQPIIRRTPAGLSYEYSESEESDAESHVTQHWTLTDEDEQEMRGFLRSILQLDTQGFMLADYRRSPRPARWCFRKIKRRNEPAASFKKTNRYNAGQSRT
jgi:hypothetical protein